MTGTATFAELFDLAALREGGSIADYFDHLLDRCALHGGSMAWQDGGWLCRMPGPDGGLVEAVAPFKKSHFRALLARLAVRCAAVPGGSFDPYGGEGRFQVGADPVSACRAVWVNTATEQRVEFRFAV